MGVVQLGLGGDELGLRDPLSHIIDGELGDTRCTDELIGGECGLFSHVIEIHRKSVNSSS